MLEFPEQYNQLLNNGFNIPLYLKNRKFKLIRDSFIGDLEMYYSSLNGFIEFINKYFKTYDKNLLLMLLPLATNIQYIMHGSTKEISYMTQQRVKPGGHINYRDLAYRVAKEVSKRDKLLSSILINSRPSYLNREEFFDRS